MANVRTEPVPDSVTDVGGLLVLYAIIVFNSYPVAGAIVSVTVSPAAAEVLLAVTMPLAAGATVIAKVAVVTVTVAVLLVARAVVEPFTLLFVFVTTT
jgi:hypothetical protein